MPRVVEPTFIAYNLQATFYEVGNRVMVRWGGRWRSAELIRVEHMVRWRGCWRMAESVRIEQRGKPKRQNAKKGKDHQTKVKETVHFYVRTGKTSRSSRIVNWYNIRYPVIRQSVHVTDTPGEISSFNF
ncbi:hypothetical protein BDQ17DRAFT_1330667 [Cyathus striatus]|nr:hypothetical protein BDQ17DRAFT_1330667 [Cyathus striatus]